MKTDVQINVHIIGAVIQAVHNRGLLPGAREQGVLRVLQHPLFFLWATVNCCEKKNRL